MTRIPWRIAITSVVLASIGVAAVARQGSSAAPDKAGTTWTATSREAARIARVEAGLPPVTLRSGPPMTLDVESWMQAVHVPGMSVAVLDGGRVVWARAYGVKEAGKPDPVTLGTLFQAGSISKPVTALAVLHHVEQGRLSLDEDINDTLRSWKVPDNEWTRVEKVTLRRLLSHSAGLTVHGFPGYAPTEAVPTTVQVLDGTTPANTVPVRVDLVPGTRFRYSGGGTTVVQLALVDRLGTPFPQIMQETVFTPLDLHDSTYQQPLPSDREVQAATGHRDDGRIVEGRWHVYPEMAAAGLWTTPWDLAQVAIEVSRSRAGRSNRILSQKMARLMLTPQAEESGLGFFVDASKKTDRFGHGGADEGFRALLEGYAASGRGVAIMTNSDSGFLAMQPLVDSIAREYRWPGYTPRTATDVLSTLALVSRLRGLDAALTEYRAMRKARPAAEFWPGQLNALGCGLLAEKRTDDAIRVFRLNVELFPTDANAHDSLGEAYIAAGLNELAIASYRRSLALDPTNQGAATMLRKLGVE